MTKALEEAVKEAYKLSEADQDDLAKVIRAEIGAEKDRDKPQSSDMRIDLYVAEKAVARHEQQFQLWIESLAEPLRYVCFEDKPGCFTPVTTSLGDYIPKFGSDCHPKRHAMSAFSGFSVSRDQRGVWFREVSGAAEEDRISIYSFIVPRVLGEVVFVALRERVARKILRERNEQAVLLTHTAGMPGDEPGQGSQLVEVRSPHYADFGKAFLTAANLIAATPRYDLAWRLLHLLQLLERDLWATIATDPEAARGSVLTHLHQGTVTLVRDVFGGKIIGNASLSVLSRWAKAAAELHKLGQAGSWTEVSHHVQDALAMPILKIADSIWRYPSHRFAGAVDIDCSSCGAEAFAFLEGLDATSRSVMPSKISSVTDRLNVLQRLWNDKQYLPHLLIRDWRGLFYDLDIAGSYELAAAFGFRPVDAIERSGISEEVRWYHGVLGPVLCKYAGSQSSHVRNGGPKA